MLEWEDFHSAQTYFNEGCTIEGGMSAFNKCHSLFTGSGLLTMRHLATLQPSVPAPSNRHFVEETASRSSDGISLHLISFRFRSTEDSASLGWEKISEPPLMTIAGMRKSNTISLCPISPLFYCLFHQASPPYSLTPNKGLVLHFLQACE